MGPPRNTNANPYASGGAGWGTTPTSGRTPFASRTPNPYTADSRTPAWNAASRTPNPYADSRTPAWNASSRTPNPYAEGGRTPAWNVGSRTPNPYATGTNASSVGSGAGSGWGGATPGRNAVGWQTPGRTSAPAGDWGTSPSQPTANASSWGNAAGTDSGWGSAATPAPASWDNWASFICLICFLRVLTLDVVPFFSDSNRVHLLLLRLRLLLGSASDIHPHLHIRQAPTVTRPLAFGAHILVSGQVLPRLGFRQPPHLAQTLMKGVSKGSKIVISHADMNSFVHLNSNRT